MWPLLMLMTLAGSACGSVILPPPILQHNAFIVDWWCRPSPLAAVLVRGGDAALKQRCCHSGPCWREQLHLRPSFDGGLLYVHFAHGCVPLKEGKGWFSVLVALKRLLGGCLFELGGGRKETLRRKMATRPQQSYVGSRACS